MNVERLAFLDLETTGLSPEFHVPIECGVIVTDASLNPIAQRRWIIQYWGAWETILSEVVVNMHTASGLREECRSVDAPMRHEADAQIADWLRDQGCEQSPLCGSSPHFDRGFLRSHMPKTFGVFCHRNLDASQFKIYAATLGIELPPARKAHRTIEDCEDSIKLLRWGQERFLLGHQMLR